MPEVLKTPEKGRGEEINERQVTPGYFGLIDPLHMQFFMVGLAALRRLLVLDRYRAIIANRISCVQDTVAQIVFFHTIEKVLGKQASLFQDRTFHDIGPPRKVEGQELFPIPVSFILLVGENCFLDFFGTEINNPADHTVPLLRRS